MNIVDSADPHYAKAMARLERAWKIVSSSEYLEKCQTSARDHGEGINLFKFLRPKNSEKGNCEYYYANKESTLWNILMEGLPDRREFERIYQHTTSYAICVSVPADEHSEDTVQTVKVFRYDTNDILF